MKTKRVHFRGVVGKLIFCAAFMGVSTAEETPPVFKQLATIIKMPAEHSHPGLDKLRAAAQTASDDQFKINRRIFSPFLRFIDWQDVWFDDIQQPKLVTIRGDKYPLSSSSFVVDYACTSPNLLDCVTLTEFPFAFSIHMLQNDDLSITPHAFIYVPVRLDSSTAQEKGDHFFLVVMHIPPKDRDCEIDYPDHLAAKKNCLLVRNLSTKWSVKKRDYVWLLADTAIQYHDYLQDIFEGYCVDNPYIAGEPAGCDAIALDVENVVRLLFGLDNKGHNEIIHGKLE